MAVCIKISPMRYNPTRSVVPIAGCRRFAYLNRDLMSDMAMLKWTPRSHSPITNNGMSGPKKKRFTHAMSADHYG